MTPSLPSAMCLTAGAQFLFDPDDYDLHWVRKICALCPVQPACLEWALARKTRGFWAGHTPRELAKLRRQRSRQTARTASTTIGVAA